MTQMSDVIVIGAGPAGVAAALRAADLGAAATLICRDEFGGMAANDGPVPVRTLAHAARLLREARQLGQFGIATSDPALDYSGLMARVRKVVTEVRAHSTLRQQIDSLGVTVYERAGNARIADPHSVQTENCHPRELWCHRVVLKTAAGVQMHFSKYGIHDRAGATIAVVAIGWVADVTPLNLAAAGVEADERGFLRVDDYLRTTAAHIFAAGDVTGRLMLVPPAIQDGFIAATNAVLGATMPIGKQVNPIGSFTDPEYAQVGITEAEARETHDVATATVHFDSTTRTIIDGRTFGFCKLSVDRTTSRILRCHVVGERSVELTQVAAIAIASGMRVDELARVPLSFPTYAGILGRVAASAARQLNLQVNWNAHQAEGHLCRAEDDSAPHPDRKG
jgi:dihydrolipoamide dehydrogenase